MQLGFLRVDGLLLQPRQNPLRLRHLHLQLPILQLNLAQSCDFLLQHAHRVVSTNLYEVQSVIGAILGSRTFLFGH